MKTVTTPFKNVLNSVKTERARRVYFKRRYWVESTQSYSWESSWTLLAENLIVSVSPITGKLDTDKLNEFKISNVTINLKNTANEWKSDNPSGYFGPTTATPQGFEPYWTKFKIEIGIKLPDGTTEYISLFIGLATRFQSDAGSGIMQTTVQGLEALLINASAEDVSVTVTAENVGTGNGSLKDFTTAQPGVGFVDLVTVAGVIQKAGSEYSVSQLNETTLGAKITFGTAPASGTVAATYRYWKQNEKIEDLVEDLLTAAGISAGAQYVDPVLFDTVGNTVVIDEQSQWATGTGTALDMTTAPGSVMIDITNSANYETFDDFSGTLANWTTTGNITSSISGGKLRIQKPGTTYYGTTDATPNSSQIGVWEFVYREPASSMSWPDEFRFAFISSSRNMDTISPFYPLGHNGNYIKWKIPLNDGLQYWYLYLNNTQVASVQFNVAADTDHTIKIIRYSSGLTQVFINGTLRLQATETSVITPNYFGFGITRLSSIQDQYFDDVKRPKSTFTGSWVSDTYDLSASVTAFGTVTADYAENGGTVTFETRTSADDITYDDWTELATNWTVQSTVRRYLQVRVSLTHPSSSYSPPIVNSIRIPYSTQTALISLANFTGQTVYEAIQSLGSFANYEWGFKEDETFFFRSKSVDSVPDVDFRHDTNIVADGLTGLENGYERTYSEVQATYGDFVVTVKDSGDIQSGPLGRFGFRRLEIDGGNLLIAPDTDVASGIAALFYSDFSIPRKAFKLKTKLFPHVDLSDTASVTYFDNLPSPAWLWGDVGQEYGDTTIEYYGGPDQSADELLVKVVGYRHDYDNAMSEFDMEEIL